MKRYLAVGGLVLTGVFVLGLVSFSPVGMSWGYGPGWGQGRGMGRGPGAGAGPRHFDPASLQTITGKVVSYESVGGFGPHGMKALKIEKEGKEINVILGPEFYLDDKKFSAKSGEEVTIVAAETAFRTKTFYIAKSVKKGETTLVLRDEAGFPVWRGQGMRAGYGQRDCPGYGRGAGRGFGPGRGWGPGMWGPRGPAQIIPPTP